jgi:antitoxin component HigA of HigAB toxin-antitoxin module
MLFIAPLLAFLFLVGLTFAPKMEAASFFDQLTKSITLKDLGVTNPGILPTNPFYFLKEVGRGINRIFTFDPISQAELELKIANEKAAELMRLEELTPDNVEAIGKAVDSYKESVEKLKSIINSFTETSGNPRVNDLLNNLTEKTLKHEQLFKELEGKYETLKNKTEGVRNELDSVMSSIPDKLDNPEEFKARLEKGISEQEGGIDKELKILNFINQLENKSGSIEVRGKLSQLKDDEVLKFEGKIKSIMPEISKNPGDFEEYIKEILPKDGLEQVELLDEIRERTTDDDLKLALGELRNGLISDAEKNKEITAEKIIGTIKEAEDVVKEVEARLNAGIAEIGSDIESKAKEENVGQEAVLNDKFESVKALLSRAKFNLEEAKKFNDASQSGAAYGQANSALVLAESALGQILKRTEDASGDVNELKNKLGVLMEFAKSQELTRGQYPELFMLFDEAEKMIINSKENDGIRNVKSLLSEIDFLIKNIIEIEKADKKADSGSDEQPASFMSSGSASGSDTVAGRGDGSRSCATYYDPVCGADGRNYSNACFSELAKTKIAYKGECKNIKVAE